MAGQFSCVAKKSHSADGFFFTRSEKTRIGKEQQKRKYSMNKVLKTLTAPFNPVEFFGKGWSFWRGPEDGDGLHGKEARDRASLAHLRIDYANVEFITCLGEREISVSGEDKLLRLRDSGRIIYGATAFMGLLQNYCSSTDKAESILEKLHQLRGLTYVDFFGDILRGPDGWRYALCFRRDSSGHWEPGHIWLYLNYSIQHHSAVSKGLS
jgi:hypothetical protein